FRGSVPDLLSRSPFRVSLLICFSFQFSTGKGGEAVALRILSIGFQAEHLLRRNAALSQAGFKVDSATDAVQPRRLLRAGKYEVLVLGPYLPEDLRNNLASEAKAANPRIAIVMLYIGSIANAEQADTVLNAVTAEQNLAEAIRHVVQLKQGQKISQANTG
ncbi:MAG: hypothetical protein ACRD4F_06775, partial [Candidatus Angelobacter sp.]